MVHTESVLAKLFFPPAKRNSQTSWQYKKPSFNIVSSLWNDLMLLSFGYHWREMQIWSNRSKKETEQFFFSASFHHKLNVYDIEQSSHKQEQNCNAKITKNKNNSLSERLTTAMTDSNTFTLKPLINHCYKLNHPKNKQRPWTICRENTLKLNPSHIQCKTKDTAACTYYSIGLLAQTAISNTTVSA